jgi:hypothetical protein
VRRRVTTHRGRELNRLNALLSPVRTLVGAHERVFSNPAREISGSANEIARFSASRQGFVFPSMYRNCEQTHSDVTAVVRFMLSYPVVSLYVASQRYSATRLQYCDSRNIT